MRFASICPSSMTAFSIEVTKNIVRRLSTFRKAAVMLVTTTPPFTAIALALLFTTCEISSGSAQGQSFTTIDVPGAFSTSALGINSKGDIVGEYTNLTGNHGFLLSSGAFTTIEVPGAS